ncbi:MAG: UDP-N-acetylmuramate dehydrogenase [Phycisphaeraceae bacterium]
MPLSSPADLLADLSIQLEPDADLGPRTWYGIGGRAEVLAHPDSPETLAELVRRCRESDVPMRILGSGANLLVVDRVPGVVVTLDAPAFRAVVYEDDHAVVAGAGVDLMKLVLETARKGLSGLEHCAGIPATVGGAVRMNCGGAFGDIASAVRSVRVVTGEGELIERTKDELGFGYRRSDLADQIVVDVHFALTPDEPHDLMRRVKEIFFYKKNSQPMADRSAGCAFKNPAPDPETDVVRSAGKLIDDAGLKNHRVGGAWVSERHANFVVADESAAPRDILRVIEDVERTVEEVHNIRLEREVVVWP